MDTGFTGTVPGGGRGFPGGGGRQGSRGAVARPLLALAAGLFFAVSGCACTAETALQEILGLSAEPPEFRGWRAVSARELSFRFSRPVSVRAVRLDPSPAISSVAGGTEVRLFLLEPCGDGIKMVADLLVEDVSGNTLNVLAPFRSRNDNMPALVITEVRTEYSKPKVEFIEFRALEAGSLGGMRLYLGGVPDDAPFYEFPSVSVQAGEYVVLHLRNLDGAYRDELGEGLGETPYTKDNEAWATARDLWVPGAVKHINKRGAAVYLVDQDDRVLDALVFCENPAGAWADEKLSKAAAFLAKAGAWRGAAGGAPLPADAASSAGTTATRTINRRQGADTDGAADWYVTVTSGATPGQLNNPAVYGP